MLRPDPPRAATLRKPAVFWSLAALAVGLRLSGLATAAHVDQESWSIVADIALDGENVYAQTTRYNYGPAWMYVVAGLKWMAGDAHFRLAMCILLSAVDVATAAVLRARRLTLVAVLFLFSPWTILVSGYHHMFDNVAVLLGLLAVTWVEARPGMRGDEQRLSTLSLRDTLIGAALIGCSIIAKHVLWLFPVWMAFRTRSLPRRILWAGVPALMFVFSFLPFWPEGRENILDRVLFYAAAGNAPAFSLLAPNIVDLLFGCDPHHWLARKLFACGLVLVGLLLRRRTLLEYYVAYLLFVVLLSSAIYNHFFVIAVLFTILYRNVWSLLFHAAAIPYCIVYPHNLELGERLPDSWKDVVAFAGSYGPHFFVTLLALCYLSAFWGERIRRGWEIVRARIIGSLVGQQ